MQRDVDRPAGERKTLGSFPNSPHRKGPDSSVQLHGHSFLEDVRNHIMPYGRTKGRPKIDVRLQPDSQELREQICLVLGEEGYGPRWDAGEAVEDFIRELAFRLALYSKLHFEIARLRIADSPRATRILPSSELPVALPIPERIPGRVLRVGPITIQLIPRLEWPTFGRILVVLPTSSVWTLRVPTALGGSFRHKMLNAFLAESSAILPRYLDTTGESPFQDRNLDLSLFHTYGQELLAAATSLWGWPARSMWADNSTEYFTLHRNLKFAHSMAVFREYLVAALSEFFGKAGMPVQIQLTGVPSSTELASLLLRLPQGKATFKETLDATAVA